MKLTGVLFVFIVILIVPYSIVNIDGGWAGDPFSFFFRILVLLFLSSIFALVASGNIYTKTFFRTLIFSCIFFIGGVCLKVISMLFDRFAHFEDVFSASFVRDSLEQSFLVAMIGIIFSTIYIIVRRLLYKRLQGLEDYIEGELGKGVPKEKIIQDLKIHGGWNTLDIRLVFVELFFERLKIFKILHKLP